MGSGIITTARGEQLELDKLIEQSKRPIGVKDKDSEKKKRDIPKTRNLNVRAFSPTMDDVKVPEVPDEIKSTISRKPIPSSYNRVNDGVAHSLADMTGIRVDKPKHFTPEELKKRSRDDIQNEVLSDIMEGLKDKKPKESESDKHTRKRTRTRKH